MADKGRLVILADEKEALANAVHLASYMYTRAPPYFIAGRVARLSEICGHFDGSDAIFRPMVYAYQQSPLREKMTFGNFIMAVALLDESARLKESGEVDSLARAADRKLKTFQLIDVLAFLSVDSLTARKDKRMREEFAKGFVAWYKKHGGDPHIFLETQSEFVGRLLSDATTEDTRGEFMKRLIAKCWKIAPLLNDEKTFLSTHWSSVLPWQDRLGEYVDDVSGYMSTHAKEREYIAEHTVLQMDMLLQGFRPFPFHQRTIGEDDDKIRVEENNDVEITNVRHPRAWEIDFSESTQQKQALDFPRGRRSNWATGEILAQLEDLFSVYYLRVTTVDRLARQFAQAAIDELDMDTSIFGSMHAWMNYAYEEVGRMVFIFEEMSGQNLLDLTWSFEGNEQLALEWEAKMLDLYTSVKRQQMKNIKGLREVHDEAAIIDPRSGDDDDDSSMGESSYDDVDPNASSSEVDMASDDDNNNNRGSKVLEMTEAQKRVFSESPWLNFFYLLECHGVYLAELVRDSPTAEVDVLTSLVLDRFAPLFDGQPLDTSPVYIQTLKKSLLLRADAYRDVFEFAYDQYVPPKDGNETPMLVALKRNLWAYSQVVFADRAKRKQTGTWREWKPSLVRGLSGFHLFRIFRAQFELGYYGIDRMPGALVSIGGETEEWEHVLSTLAPFVNDKATLTKYHAMNPASRKEAIDTFVWPSQLLVEQAWSALPRDVQLAWTKVANDIERTSSVNDEWWLDDRGEDVPYPHWQDSKEVLKSLYVSIEQSFQRTVKSRTSFLIEALPVSALSELILQHVRSVPEKSVWRTIATSCKTMTKVFERLETLPGNSIHGSADAADTSFCRLDKTERIFEKFYVSHLIDKRQMQMQERVFAILLHRADVPATLIDRIRHGQGQPHDVYSGLGKYSDTLSVVVLRALVESGDYANSIFRMDDERVLEENVESESSEAGSDEDLSDLSDDNDGGDNGGGSDAMDIDDVPDVPNTRKLPLLAEMETVRLKEPSEHFFHMLDCHGVDVPGAFASDPMERGNEVDDAVMKILSDHAHLWFSYQHTARDTVPQQLAKVLLENAVSRDHDEFESAQAAYVARNSATMEHRQCLLRARLWAFTKVAQRLRPGLTWDTPYLHSLPGFHLFRIVNSIFGTGLYSSHRVPSRLLPRFINGSAGNVSNPLGDREAKFDRKAWETFYMNPLFTELGESTKGQLNDDHLAKVHGGYNDTQFSKKAEEVSAARLLLIDQAWLLLPSEMQKAWIALAGSFRQGPLRYDRAWWFDNSPTAVYPRWLHGPGFYDQVIQAIRTRFLDRLAPVNKSHKLLRGPEFMEKEADRKKDVDTLEPDGFTTTAWKTTVKFPSSDELDEIFKGTGPLIELVDSIKAGRALNTLTLLIDNTHLRNIWKGTIIYTNTMADILRTVRRFSGAINAQLEAALPHGMACFKRESNRAAVFELLTRELGVQHLDKDDLSSGLSLIDLAAPSANDLLLHKKDQPHHMDIGLGRLPILAMVLARMMVQCVDSGTPPPVFPRKRDDDDNTGDKNDRPLKKPRTTDDWRVHKLTYLMQKMSILDFH
jgi:hypothetical protein